MNSTRKCILIGAGSIGQQLLRILPRDLELICVDREEKALQAAREIRGSELETQVGDATSRLVLEELGVDDAEVVVISSTSERVNLEVARVLKNDFQPRRVLSVGITPQGIATLESLGVEVVGIFSLSATGLRNKLEQKTKAVQGVGLGKNEILEVEVHANSRLANKPLASLKPKSWRAGIIYREGNIIIPKGETVLRPKDKVIILGDPKVLRTVAELLTFRFTHFPLEYGDTLVAWLSGPDDAEVIEEIGYLLTVFPIPKAFFILQQDSPELKGKLQEVATGQRLREVEMEILQGPIPKSLRTVLQTRGRRPCMVVLPRSAVLPTGFSLFGHYGDKRLLRQLTSLVGCPLLLAGGTHPYVRVAVPCLQEAGLYQALETTLEMSSAIHYDIEALFVHLSRYITSEEESREFEEMKKAVSDLGLIYKTPIRTVSLSGNPIKAITAAAAERNLLVSATGSWTKQGFFRTVLNPDENWGILRRSPVSALLIPTTETLI